MGSGRVWKSLAEGNIYNFQETSAVDVWEATHEMQRLQPTMPSGDFESLEKNLGLKFLPLGLLCSKVLRAFWKPVDFVYDVLHNFFCNGIVSNEVKLLTDRLSRHGLPRKDLIQNLKCDVQAQNPAHLQPKQLGDKYFGTTWKVAGSVQQSLLPLLHFWSMSYRGPGWQELTDELDCFRLLCRRVFFVVLLQNTGQSWILRSLTELQQLHHEKFGRVYGIPAYKPKNHYTLHQGGHRQTHTFLRIK